MRKIDWSLAVCRQYDPELWFDPTTEAEAQAICFTCPVRLECLDRALATPERYGIWGGTTESERRRYGFKKSRVHCPGCRSLDITELLGKQTVEVCRACGLSWRI